MFYIPKAIRRIYQLLNTPQIVDLEATRVSAKAENDDVIARFSMRSNKNDINMTKMGLSLRLGDVSNGHNTNDGDTMPSQGENFHFSDSNDEIIIEGA